MSPTLELHELPESSAPSVVEGLTALAGIGEAVTLRFRVAASHPRALEALRYARRSLLREERTLGVEPGEPSLEDAVFSPAEVFWTVESSQRDWSVRKLRELLARAQRNLSGGPDTSAAPRT